jgi:flagellar motor switch protein FliN/FliY
MPDDDDELDEDAAALDDSGFEPSGRQTGRGGTELGGLARRRESAFMGVPIDVMISVGKARPLVSELVKLRRDSVLPLESKIDDPVELYIGDRLIARGELQEMDDDSGRLGVRLTEVADLTNGV